MCRFPGITVAFAITGGTGSISPQSITSNALGEATVRWTLGKDVGAQQASVTALNLGPVILTATAIPLSCRPRIRISDQDLCPPETR